MSLSSTYESHHCSNMDEHYQFLYEQNIFIVESLDIFPHLKRVNLSYANYFEPDKNLFPTVHPGKVMTTLFPGYTYPGTLAPFSLDK